MSSLRRLLLRLWNAVVPGGAERDFTREVASHLDLLEDEYRRRGLSDDDARRAARRAFGAHAALDHQRDARSFVWIDDLRRDTIYAIRTLARSPGFTVVAVLTLALAVGANTTIFAVVDHVLMRSLPAPHADRLVRLYSSNPSRSPALQDVSVADTVDWRRAATSFDLLTVFGGTSMTMTGGAEPESIVGMTVDPAFFAMTGVRLALGRAFAPPDYTSVANAALGARAVDAVTGDAAIILSDALWRRQFGGDPHVVGRRIELNGHPAVIAGVMPAGFQFNESAWGVADCWSPLVESPLLAVRRYRQYTAIGRLKPGVGVAAAEAEMSAIASSLQQAHPQDDGKWTVRVEPLKASMTSEVRPTLLILFGGVGCVLLIACANIASLLIVRATGRSREVAVRIALGAGRGRIIRQWLTESALVAVTGGAVGFLFAVWALPALTAYAPNELPRLAEVAVDARALTFCLALSLVTGLVCGVAPALALGQGRTDALRAAAAVGGGRRRWLRPSLVVLQVSLAVMLLVGAGLMARSVLAVRALDLGFDPHNALSFGVNLRGASYREVSATLAFTHDLLSRLAALPDVEAAGNGFVPLVGGLSESFETEGRTEAIASELDVVSGGYFRALRMRLRSGRLFTEADNHTGQPVAIVNQAFAHTAWGTGDAVGRRVRPEGGSAWLTVVGIIDNTRRSSLEAAPPPIVFLPLEQSRIGMSTNFVLRTTGPPSAALTLVRDVVRQIDPTQAVSRVATMDERVARFVAPRQFNLWLIGLFALLAVVLAVVGIYGLVSELVMNRTAEIGVRMALGATRTQVIRLVAGGSVLVTAAGVALGLGGAAAVTRSLGSMLYGVTPLDPATLVIAPAALVLAAGLAAVAPARRATRVDPVIALRRE
jgi:predicted permease